MAAMTLVVPLVKVKVAPEHDALFKRALVAFVLHAAARPRNELTAWTVNFQEPRVNLVAERVSLKRRARPHGEDGWRYDCERF